MNNPNYKGIELLPLSVIEAARAGDAEAVELCQQPSAMPNFHFGKAITYRPLIGKEDAMFNTQMLADMRQQNIKEVNDTSLPPEQRMMNYLEQVKNPYLFRCGDAVVSVRFSAGGTALDGLLKNYFSGLKKG